MPSAEQRENNRRYYAAHYARNRDRIRAQKGGRHASSESDEPREASGAVTFREMAQRSALQLESVAPTEGALAEFRPDRYRTLCMNCQFIARDPAVVRAAWTLLAAEGAA
jgi:hypothetical protein